MIRYESNIRNGSQLWLRRRIADLERLQVQRIELVAERKRALDETIGRAELELTNLRAQVSVQDATTPRLVR